MARKNDTAALKILKSRLDAGEIGRLYLFWGEERYLLEHYLRRIKKCVALEDESNCVELSGQNLTPEALSEALLTCPMFAERKLVTVFDYDIVAPDAEMRATAEELLSGLSDCVCLIFVYGPDKVPGGKRREESKPEDKKGRGKKSKIIEKTVAENGLVVEFGRQNDAALRRWTINWFKELGKTCYGREADKIVRLSGGLMYPTLREIEKIAAYAPGEVITQEDIDAVATPSTEALFYQLTDAVAARANTRSLELLNTLYAQGLSPMEVYRGIARSVKQLYCARLLLDAGKGEAEFIRIFHAAGFVARIVLRQTSRLRIDAARKCVLACADAESELFAADPNPAAAIEMLILRLCSV